MNKYSLKDVIISIIGVSVAIVIIVGGILSSLFGNLENAGRFFQVLYTINRQYVRTPPSDNIIYHAISGMVKGLEDPYSYYLGTQDYERFKSSIEGKYIGIGAVLTSTDFGSKIVDIIDGGAAADSRLQVGDIILAVDNQLVDGVPLEQVVSKIVGKDKTIVNLRIKREDGQEFELNLTRKPFIIPTIEIENFQNNIAYIHILRFTDETPEKIQDAVDEFRYNGINKLIIDLRGNPGGSLSAVHKIGQLLLPAGDFVQIFPRSESVQTLRISDLNQSLFKLVVLVDKNSASASEILASAVQDLDAGVVIGENTYGKGTVQALFPVVGETGLRMTIAEYRSGKGRIIDGVGVKPDIEVTNVDQKVVFDMAIEQLNK